MSSCQVACKRRDWKRINICHFPENHRQMYQVFHTCARLKHDFKASLPYEEGPFDISWLPAACLEVRGPPQRLRCAFGSAGSAQGAAGGSWGAAAFPGAEQQESAGMSVHVSSRWGLGLHCWFEEKKGRWCLLGRWSWNWEDFPERIGLNVTWFFVLGTWWVWQGQIFQEQASSFGCFCLVPGKAIRTKATARRWSTVLFWVSIQLGIAPSP